MATEDLEFRVMKNVLRLLNSLPDQATRDRVFAYVTQKLVVDSQMKPLEVPAEQTIQ